MKIVSNYLQAVATQLNIEYIRSMSLTEADVDIHNLKSDKPIIIYNGPSNIETRFDGAMIIDDITTEIYFVVKKTSKDMIGTDVDDLLQIAKRLVNQTYTTLNKDTAEDIQPYSSEAIEGFTDAYVGYRVEMVLPYYNEGCFGTVSINYNFLADDGGFANSFAGVNFQWSAPNGWQGSFLSSGLGSFFKDEALKDKSCKVKISGELLTIAGGSDFGDLEIFVTDSLTKLGGESYPNIGGGNLTIPFELDLDDLNFADNRIVIGGEVSNTVGSPVFVLKVQALEISYLDL